jgi:lysine 2,3-aminomutase
MAHALPLLKELEGPAEEPEPPSSASEAHHRDLRDGDFWRRVPAYTHVSRAEFLDHQWQARNSITRPEKLLTVLRDLTAPEFVADVAEALKEAPMALRLSPYVLSLIDWSDPYADPLRLQFLPLATSLRPDHPLVGLDSLGERHDAAVPGLVHRYPDKVLFLALDTCPVYCRFCTRSYAIGPDNGGVEKVGMKVSETRWEAAFQYIKAHPSIEDVVISGGDTYQLKPHQLRTIGLRLLDIPHVRRMRFATKGLAVMPMKILTDDAWFSALTEVHETGRRRRKDVVVHTHINHPNEITAITEEAVGRLFEAGMTVRNQAVLQRGVNDDVATMRLLVKRLSYINVQPYYVYVHDLVRGVEDLRTSVHAAAQLEKALRGTTAGFNTPTFVVDAPGGGGKRDVHSFEHYDRMTGVSVYTAPVVKPGQFFCYVDPLDTLSDAGRERWADSDEHHAILREALAGAGATEADLPRFLRAREPSAFPSSHDLRPSVRPEADERATPSHPPPALSARDRAGVRVV